MAIIGAVSVRPEGAVNDGRLERFVGDNGFFDAQILDEWERPVNLANATVSTRTTLSGSTLRDDTPTVYSGVEHLGLVKAFVGTLDTGSAGSVKMTFRVYESVFGTVTYGPLTIKVGAR